MYHFYMLSNGRMISPEEGLRREKAKAELEAITGWSKSEIFHKVKSLTTEEIDEVSFNYQMGWHPSQKKERTKVSNEFVEVNIFLPKALAQRIQETNDEYLLPPTLQNRLLMLIRGELPEPVTLSEGMEYDYVVENPAQSRRYRIVSLGTDEVVIRRVGGNTKGPAGSKLTEKRSKIEQDIRSGRAVVIGDE